MLASNNLKQVCIAMLAYHDEHGHLPPAVVRDRDGRPLYSWRVLILPYIEEDKLYKEFHLDEPWDSPHNLTLLPRMPKVYASAGEQPPEPHRTFLQVLVGPGTTFEKPEG